MNKIEYPSSLIYPTKELWTSSNILRRNIIEDNSYQFITNGDRCYREQIVCFISQQNDNRK
ncbi:hypothetical protein GW17_00041653 [Ensete ventricosum]|nr:hypothetical protein GW17_00041653 [Ensete ventricosum]